MYNSFDTNVCIEEIIPAEYEDWLKFCGGDGYAE